MCFVLISLYVLILGFEIIIEEVSWIFGLELLWKEIWLGGFGFLIISRELEFSLSGYIIER